MSLPLENDETSGPPAVRYRALCPLAVASVVAGALSVLTAFAWFLAAIPVLGIGLGWQALRRIRQSPSELTGERLALLGIELSVGFWIVGSSWLYFVRVSEKPYGYEAITYEMLQPDPSMPADPIPQSALEMQDKRVFVKGYMQPRRQQTGIRDFILCPNNGECQFCIPNPKRTEKIRVMLQGDMETNFTPHLIGVGGRFEIDATDPSDIPYSLKADYLH